MGAGVAVWAWFARQVGPEQFGLWNYSIALTSIFGSLSALGLDGVVVKELVKRPDAVEKIIGTTLVLRLTAGLLAGTIAVITVSLAREGDPTVILLVAFNAAVYIFQASLSFDAYFQAELKVWYAVWATNIAFIATTIIRLALLLSHASLLWFGVTMVVEAAFSAGFLYMFYRRIRGAHRWVFHAETAVFLLKQSWPLLFSGLAVMLYMRLDQVMLASMAQDKDLGLFSAALRISEVWYFVPMSIATATFPILMRYRERDFLAYERLLQLLYDGLAWLGILVALMVTVVSPYIVYLIYGESYAGAVGVLTVQVWVGVTVSISFACGKWMLVESLQWNNLRLTLFTLAINVILNLLLIPRYGAMGAAWASLVAQSSGIPMHFAFRPLRANAWRMIAAFAAPMRLLRYLNRR